MVIKELAELRLKNFTCTKFGKEFGKAPVLILPSGKYSLSIFIFDILQNIGPMPNMNTSVSIVIDAHRVDWPPLRRTRKLDKFVFSFTIFVLNDSENFSVEEFQFAAWSVFNEINYVHHVSQPRFEPNLS